MALRGAVWRRPGFASECRRRLHERDRDFFAAMAALGQPITQDEIALLMGIGQAEVSRVMAKALAKMRARWDLDEPVFA